MFDDDEDHAINPSRRKTSTTRGAASGPSPRISTALACSTGTRSRIFAVVAGLLVWVLVRYRRRGRDDIPSQRQYVVPIEVLYTVLPILLLWGAFLTNYPATRDIYFTVAMLHVLAEVPFLLRLL